MTTTQFGKLLRKSLGLPPTATDEEVNAAVAKRDHAAVCSAVGCHCAETLADGAPGLTADKPLAVIMAPEFAEEGPGCRNGICDGSPARRKHCRSGDALGSVTDSCCNEPVKK